MVLAADESRKQFGELNQNLKQVERLNDQTSTSISEETYTESLTKNNENKPIQQCMTEATIGDVQRLADAGAKSQEAS